MRTKKPAGLASPSGLLGVLSHAAMGAAIGLAFALFLIFANPSGITAVVEHGGTHALTVMVGKLVLTFGIGTTVTGVVFVITEDD